MAIPIIDLHCDALLRMDQRGDDFLTSPLLDVSLSKLRAGYVRAQAFAIFIEPDLSQADKVKSALHQAYYFQQHVARPENGIVAIKDWDDFSTLQPGEIGAFLTIEGVDFFDGDMKMWHIFRELGVLLIGLTWNLANAAADGLTQDLGRGVTMFGRELIALNNAQRIFTDVSHLSERSFWDVLEHADYVIASHSNATTICRHPRNLTDAQIKAMILKKAPMHVVYCPEFIVESGDATMSDLIKHIDHICALGGKHLVGFGSDFDGITKKVIGLEHAGMQQNFINELLKFYSEEDVRGFAGENFLTSISQFSSTR